MIILEERDYYCSQTGKLLGKQSVFSHRICDWCGEQLESVYCEYKLDYLSNDPCYGCDEESLELCQKYDLDYNYIESEPYCFCTADDSFENAFCEMLFMKNMVENYYLDDSIANGLREARIKILKKLLEEGKLKPEQLRG